MTNINEAKIFGLSSTVNKSLTIAMAATEAAQQPMACTNLITINWLMSVTNKHDTDVKTNRAKPKNKGFFLPNLSNNGPYNSCPAEIPIKKLANDNDTLDTSVFKSLAIALKPGKYISIEKGDNAASEPKINISKKDFDFAIFFEGAKMIKSIYEEVSLM